MFLKAIKRLYEYDAEATERVLRAAAMLEPEQFTAVVVPGLPSVRDTLVHTFDAHVCHLSWLDGSMSRDESFARKFPPGDYPDVQSVSEMWQWIHRGTRAFIDTLTADADLERVYSRHSRDGRVLQQPLWEMMMHVVNHGTQHRSEAAVMLTAMGQSPGVLDLL
ncbi:MAG: DinB family protein [Dehalococcoidia bacterium]